jgi:hypothetical protein
MEVNKRKWQDLPNGRDVEGENNAIVAGLHRLNEMCKIGLNGLGYSSVVVKEQNVIELDRVERKVAGWEKNNGM